MKELPELAPYFSGLDIVNSTQLINIASHYVERAYPLIHSKAKLSPELDEEYVKKIVSADLLNEKNAEYFLAEVASLVGQKNLTPESAIPHKMRIVKRPQSFAETAQQEKPFRPSERIMELVSEPVTRPHMYELLESGEKAHIDEIGTRLRQDVRERIQKRIANDGSELDLTPPDLSPFVQQVDHTKCRAGHEAITDIFAYMARDEIAKTVRDAIRPQRAAEMA